MPRKDAPSAGVPAWLAVTAAALAVAAAFAVRSSLGLLFYPWEAEFGWNRATVSLVGSVGLLSYGLGQVAAGRLADRLGPRRVFAASVALLGLATLALGSVDTLWQVYLAYGCLAMLATGGASNVTGSVVVARWRIQRAALAIGWVMVGGTAGQALVVPVLAWLMERGGWRGAVTVLGAAIVLVLLPLVWVLLREPPAAGQEDEASSPGTVPGAPSLRAILARPNFWWLALTFWVCGFTTAGLVETHLIPYAEDLHIDGITAARALGVLGVFNLVGVLVSGALSDRWGYKQTLVVIYAARGASLLFANFVDAPLMLFVFAAIFGLLDFSTVPPTSALASGLFGRGQAGTVFGLVTLSHQVGSALGAYAGGLAHSVHGSYGVAFTLGALLCGAAAVMAALIAGPGARGEVREREEVASR